MNKKLIYLFSMVVALVAFASCKKNNIVVGKDVIPQSVAKIGTLLNKDTSGTYYITSSNAPYKIPIGVTSISNVDRTITFTYSSNSAVQGQQYTAPTSIVIPAGKALDSLTITGIYAGYSSSSKIDTLKIAISSSDLPVQSDKSHFILYLRKYCSVSESIITGDYTRTVDYFGGSASSQGPYTATVTGWTSTGPTTATAYIKNLGFTTDNGWGPFYPGDAAYDPGIKVMFDWTSPSSFKATISIQNYFNDGSGNSTIVSTTGTFSSCNNTITIPFTVKYAGNGSSYVTTTILSR